MLAPNVCPHTDLRSARRYFDVSGLTVFFAGAAAYFLITAMLIASV